LSQYSGEDGEEDFESDDPPEAGRHGLAAQNVIDSVDDPRSDLGDAPWSEGNEKAEEDAPDDDGWAGLPENFENSGHIAERTDAVRPGARLRGRCGVGGRHE